MIYLLYNFGLLTLQIPCKYNCMPVINKEIPCVLALDSVLSYKTIEEKGFRLYKKCFPLLEKR